MKMGLGLVLVGHLNFLLAALVHGTVLRHIGQDTQTLEYAISNILALTAGLVVRHAKTNKHFHLKTVSTNIQCQ